MSSFILRQDTFRLYDYFYKLLGAMTTINEAVIIEAKKRRWLKHPVICYGCSREMASQCHGIMASDWSDRE